MKSIATKRGKKASTNTHYSTEESALFASSSAEYMNPAQLDYFRRRLLSMRNELLQAEESTSAQLKERSGMPDSLDRASLEEILTLELRLRDRERHLFSKIEQALLRIEKGAYGWCEETDEAIGIARLLSRPTAILCIEAQQRRERQQLIFGE